VKRLQLSVK